MKKLPLNFGTAAIILAFGLSNLTFAQTTTFAPAYTYYDPTYTTDPNATSTSTDPAATNNGNTSSSSTNTTPEPGTYDPAVLQGPSSGGQPAGTTTDTNGNSTTTDPNQPTTSNEPAPSSTTTTSTPPRTTTTRPPSRTIPNNTPTPTEPLPEPVTAECPPLDPLANQPIECPKTEIVPIIPRPPYFLGLTALLGVILFWVIFSLLNRQQNRSENRLGLRQLTHSHQQTVSSTRQRAYHQLLDFLTETAGSDQPFKQTQYQHLSSQIELLGTPAMNDLNQKIKTALNSGQKSELKPLIRELADQIRSES